METQAQPQSPWKRTHPLVPVAAASVLVMSLVGTGVFTGLIPSAFSSKAEQPQAVAGASADGKTAAAPQPTAHPARSTHPLRVTDKPATVAAACVECGRVESVQTIETPGKASGVGAVAGGVGGALVGNQFGKGNGRTAMTVVGAAGGAVAGHMIEKQVRKETSYRVTVRMDDGTTRSFPASAPGAYAVGERVKVDNGTLVRVS